MTYTNDDVRRLPVADAKDELLAELLATPYDVSDRPSSSLRHRRVLRVTLAGVAAAAVAAVGVAVVVQRPDAAPIAGGTGQPSPTSAVAPAGPSTRATVGPIGVADLDLVAMAERMPRFLLDAPGWTMDTVYGFGEGEGTLGFSRSAGAQQHVQLQWYPASGYEERFHKENDDSSIAHESTRLLGDAVTLFTYSPTDHATLLRPDGDSFVEVRGQGLGKADYLALTARLRKATVTEFIAALPAGITTPDKEGTRAQQVLADIPLPPGFAFKPDGDTLDAYQFGALVTGQVFCAWSHRYRTGDAVGKRQAIDALESSHGWKVLSEMKAEGDWPEVIWEYADRFAAGDPVPAAEVESGLGCTE